MIAKVIGDYETPIYFQKNILNIGFIPSNISYQYYYMEILKEQEGEIILDNKNSKGILLGKILEKNCLNDPNDINIYPKFESSLELNQNNIKLSFNHIDTSICQKGCYYLVTYYKNNTNDNNNLIGYEYTIHSRIWDYSEDKTDEQKKEEKEPESETYIGIIVAGVASFIIIGVIIFIIYIKLIKNRTKIKENILSNDIDEKMGETLPQNAAE